ncbi:MAG: hypothetical protein IJV33_02545 [Bacteroidaceae bacterium]|nr:hypothetical protein [Bacteroidaceae bacterium]
MEEGRGKERERGAAMISLHRGPEGERGKKKKEGEGSQRENRWTQGGEKRLEREEERGRKGGGRGSSDDIAA